MFIQENAVENVVWKMSAILSPPQYVNPPMPGDLCAHMSVNWTSLTFDEKQMPDQWCHFFFNQTQGEKSTEIKMKHKRL